MTKRQYKAALAVINKDCQTTGTMLTEDTIGCDKPATCAVGALAFAAYDKPLSTKKQNTLAACGGLSHSFLPFAKAIKRKFGLSWENLATIIDANDGKDNIRARRASVRKRLKEIAINRYDLKV
jgi:hypothetical protein